jgi:uncharacterized membrane protein
MNITTTLLNFTRAGRPPPFGEHDYFGIPTFFIWNIVIVLIIAVIFYWLLRSAGKPEPASAILKRRYALGEIDKATFDAMLKDIGE